MFQEAKSRYQEVNFKTAEPLKLVIMCYDEAIKNLGEAQRRYEAKDYEGKARALQKALDIINELNLSLDLERGGQIAKNLRSLYLFMTKTIVEADINRDVARFAEVSRMLQELGSAWKEIAAAERQEERPRLYGALAAAGASGRAWSV